MAMVHRPERPAVGAWAAELQLAVVGAPAAVVALGRAARLVSGSPSGLAAVPTTAGSDP